MESDCEDGLLLGKTKSNCSNTLRYVVKQDEESVKKLDFFEANKESKIFNLKKGKVSKLSMKDGEKSKMTFNAIFDNDKLPSSKLKLAPIDLLKKLDDIYKVSQKSSRHDYKIHNLNKENSLERKRKNLQ